MKLMLGMSVAVALSLSAGSSAAEATDFRNTATSLLALMRNNHFHPAELDTVSYRELEDGIMKLGRSANSPEEFLNGFNAYWRGGPFSHVRLYYRDPKAVRQPGNSTPPQDNAVVSLAWEGGVAILTVNSMSNSSDKIRAAYEDIAARGASKLIIDLRSNGGGAFGVLPLVGHLIDQPIDMGVFVTSKWYANHLAPPSVDQLRTATPCICTDAGFAADMETRALTSYRVQPVLPRFSGPVYVLTSTASISAAEIAAEALQASGRATIVGEKTSGKLLQPKFFSIPPGFSLMWPIGDYRTIKNGRIEGKGVTPDIEVAAGNALAVAMAQ